MITLPTDISNKVLTIGPDYKNHRGGIGAVIEIYSNFFKPFHFIPTYRPFKYNVTKIIFFAKQIFFITIYLLKHKNIQLVHIHGASKGSFYRNFFVFLLVKKIYCKKVIYHVHGGKYAVFYKNAPILTRKAIYYFCKHADAIICLSTYWEDFFKEHFAYKKIAVINNPILRPKQIANINIAEKIQLVFLGKISDDKGIFDLIEVIKENKIIYQNKIKLCIGGEGEQLRLQTYIKKEGLEDIIQYMGWLNKAEKEKLLLQSHIFILPSYFEGLPMSILEAMSYGIPIISTNIGGVVEIVKHEYNGWIIAPGDKKALQEAIYFFINYPHKIQSYGYNNREIIEKYFSSSVMNSLLKYYKTFLS